jgi:FkbM family methyltransferase
MSIRTLVDIGANSGQFSLMARMCWPECRIFAFEPLPQAADRFEATFRGDARVTLARCAVGQTRSEAVLHVSRKDDSSSLLPIGIAQTRFAPGTGEVATVGVRVAPLVDLISAGDLQPPSFLKIDVQGYEDRVLEGCHRLLDSFDFVYCELSFRQLYEGQPLADSIVGHLRSRGFQLHSVNSVSRDAGGCPVQADFLFQREFPPGVA